jgi:hypothetical protein
MAQTSIRNYSVAHLWHFCRDCIFAIPEIQREFVWDRKRVANLFDSIWRQLPIGTLLIWETDPTQRNLLRHAQQVLPPHRDHNKVIWFIIDGQQRLSALYRALEGGMIQNFNGQEINFDQQCFVFDKRFEPSRFGFVRRPQTRLGSPIKRPLSRAKTSPTQEKIFLKILKSWVPKSLPLPRFLAQFGYSLRCTSHPSGSRSGAENAFPNEPGSYPYPRRDVPPKQGERRGCG